MSERSEGAIGADRLVAHMATERTREFAAAADATFNLCGLGRAPPRAAGQAPRDYKAAVTDALIGETAHLPGMARWRGLTGAKLYHDEATGDALAPDVFAEAVRAVTATGPDSGPARTIEVRDDAGRTVRKFCGDQDAWAPFKQSLRCVYSINGLRVIAPRTVPGHWDGAENRFVPNE